MRAASLCLIALTIFIGARADGEDDQTATEINVIESALDTLKQVNAGDKQGRAALAEFERAFTKVKEELARQSAQAGKILRGPLAETDIHEVNLDIPIPSDGRVLQVDRENEQVLLSTGRKDGVKKGQLYRVYQSGKSSPDQTAWIRIIKVESRWSTATILHEYSPRAVMKHNDIIQRNDGEEPKELKASGCESK